MDTGVIEEVETVGLREFFSIVSGESYRKFEDIFFFNIVLTYEFNSDIDPCGTVSGRRVLSQATVTLLFSPYFT